MFIQLFQKTLSKEKQTSHKPRPQGSMGSFRSVFIAAVNRELKGNLRLVFTSDGVVVGVVIRRIERYDLVKIKPTESEAEH